MRVDIFNGIRLSNVQIEEDDKLSYDFSMHALCVALYNIANEAIQNRIPSTIFQLSKICVIRCEEEHLTEGKINDYCDGEIELKLIIKLPKEYLNFGEEEE